MTHIERINELKYEIINDIIDMMRARGIDEVTIPDPEELGEGAYMICYDKNGEAFESVVRRVRVEGSRELRLYSTDPYTPYAWTNSTEWDYGAEDVRLLATLYRLIKDILARDGV